MNSVRFQVHGACPLQVKLRISFLLRLRFDRMSPRANRRLGDQAWGPHRDLETLYRLRRAPKDSQRRNKLAGIDLEEIIVPRPRRP